MVNCLSNSKEILGSIPESQIARNNSMNMDSALWRYFVFQFYFSNIPSKLINGQKISTEREPLRIVITIFDQMGFLSPPIIKGRPILQDYWKKSVGWDEKISVYQIIGEGGAKCKKNPKFRNFTTIFPHIIERI